MQVDKMKLFYTLIYTVLLCGCAQTEAGHTPKAERETFLIASHQLPGDPVYNRVFMARPPEVMPKRGDEKVVPDASIIPVIHLDVQNSNLESVARTLADSMRYRSYTAASIANKKFSIDALGTIDELADTISNKAGVYVSVDHGNKELRVLPLKTKASPQLYTKHAESKELHSGTKKTREKKDVNK